MKTIKLNLFEFHELSDPAKEKAREWWRRASGDDNHWSECVIEASAAQGKCLGFDFNTRDIKLYGGGTRQEPCIWWRGFHSQGDGACFEGAWRASDVKADKVADGWGESKETTEIKAIAKAFARVAEQYPDARFSVKHSGRYYHERSVDYDFGMFPDIDADLNWSEEKEEQYKEDIEQLQSLSRDFMRWIYRRLETAYEYEQSDECVDENIKANEYTFTEDGKRHN